MPMSENDALVWDIDVTLSLQSKKRYAGSGFLVTTPSGVTAQKMLAGYTICLGYG